MREKRKQLLPIDRAVKDLDRRLADVRKEIRKLSAEEKQISTGSDDVSSSDGLKKKATQFLDTVVSKEPKSDTVRRNPSADLFDSPAEPVKDLEADLIFPKKSEPDLFTQQAEPQSLPKHSSDKSTTTLDRGSSEAKQSRLVRYLSAGSIKSYKPLKRAERLARNRFLMWIGISFLALWLLYVIVQ